MEHQQTEKLIMLADLLEERKDKQAELEYYEAQLQELITRMTMVRQEIALTETIINVIKSEKAEVIKDFIRKRDQARILDL